MILAAGTRFRIVAAADVAAADGSTVVHVQGLDDTSIDGYVAAGTLIPRDSAAPNVRSFSTGGAFSPNDDGTADTATLSGRLSKSASWTVRVRDSAGVLQFAQSGTGSTFNATWDGTKSGSSVPDGKYDVSVTAVDAWANGPPQPRRHWSRTPSPRRSRPSPRMPMSSSGSPPTATAIGTRSPSRPPTPKPGASRFGFAMTPGRSSASTP